jgi:hypothetical protein
VWTQSVRRAHTMARKIKAGTVWVNTYRAVSFTMPFGGYKASGLGRENGADAIEGYLQSKSVWINNGPGGGNPFVMKTASSWCHPGPCARDPSISMLGHLRIVGRSISCTSFNRSTISGCAAACARDRAG